MPKVLHIVTGPEDDFTRALRALDAPGGDCCDFTEGDPNYDDLLNRIFAADRVHLWPSESSAPEPS